MSLHKIEKVFSLDFFNTGHPFFSFSYALFFHIIVIHVILYICIGLANYFLNKYKVKINSDDSINFVYYGYIFLSNFIFDFVVEAIKLCNKRIFVFVCSFFTLLFFYNIASLFPHLDEPTKNINVALAFAIYGFLYIQYIALKEDKMHYLAHWVVAPLKNKPIKNIVFLWISTALIVIVNSVLTIVLLPFQLLEKLSLIFSLTFRLFGNMFGGSIVIDLLHKLQNAAIVYHVGSTVVGVQLLVFFYFGLFEGAIQAFVFTLILVNNIGMLIKTNSSER